MLILSLIFVALFADLSIMKNLLSHLFLSILCIGQNFTVHSQATIYYDDFEGLTSSWVTTDDVLPNFWIQNTCAGNGTSNSGVQSYYITLGGAIPGCGPTGDSQYAYANSPSGMLMATTFATIDGTCATGLQLSFDYKIEGNVGQDFAHVVYSTDGGFSWNVVGPELTQSAAWSTTSMALPILLDGTMFELGVRFTYDDATITGQPLAIDNFLVTGTDAIDPIISCPGDTNIYVDINCDGTMEDYTGDVTISDNCTAFGGLVVTQNPPAGTIINGTIIDTPVTMIVTDESGNSANCIFTSRTIDTMVATITCPIDTNVYADNFCAGDLEDYTSNAVVFDNCTPFGSLTVTQSPPVGTSITANQVITLTVSGAIPNIDQSCTFNALFVDTISPQIVCPTPTDIFVDNLCDGVIPDYTSSAIQSDNCTLLPFVSQSPIAGSPVTASDLITVVLTVVDGSGNSNQCQFNQPIIDTINPVITCPSNQSEFADINCFSTLSDYTSLVAANDNCSATLSVSQSPIPSSSITGTTTVTITVEDEYNNISSCNFDVSIVDTTSPLLTCPSDFSVSSGVGCMYSLTDLTSLVSANDNCTAAVSIVYSQSPSVGNSLPTGVHTITIDGIDLEGNDGTCTFDLTVQDLFAPTISVCASNQTLYADVNCEATISDYTGLVSATDNCSAIGNLVISQSPVSGSVISTTTAITITVLDENANFTTCVFNAILLDTISPTVTCPNDQLVAIDASCGYTMPDLTGLVTGTDNCSTLGNMNVSQNPIVGSLQTGQTGVFITLTDEQGNSSTCLTNMIPNDLSAPSITCPSPAPVNLGSACDFTLLNYATLSSVLDNCSGYTIDQLPLPGTVVNPSTTNITLTVTDLGGNTDVCAFNLVVFETELPTINCPGDISTCNPTINYSDPTFSDNCLVSMSQTDLSGLSSGVNFPIGITTIEYTAIDSSGNTQVCSFNVEVLDFPSPANIAIDTIYLCNETSTIVSADAITSGSGLWTLVSGQGTFNNQFANSTGLNNIGVGENVYQWTVSTASCGTLFDQIVVVNSLLDLPASTQDTIFACMDASVSLEANTPLYGIGAWTTNGTGIIDDAQSSNTTSSTSNGWQEFVWTISNGACPSTSDTLRVFAMQQPTINQNDTLVCLENDLITLSGNSPSLGQTSYWSVISGSATLSNSASTSTDAFDFGLGNTMILYSINNTVCGTISDTIRVSATLCDGFEPVIPTVITPGNLDGKNDVFTVDFLNVMYPECNAIIFNRWGSIVFESTGYEEPWNGTYQGKLLPLGTYFYRIELNDGTGEVLEGDISIIN